MSNSRWVRTFIAVTGALALAYPLRVAAAGASPDECPGYVEALLLARKALEKGDRAQSVVLLKRAQSELELCLHRSEKPNEKVVG